MYINTILGQKITELRKAGNSYKQICDLLKCSKSTVSYYCGEDQKTKTSVRAKRHSSSRGAVFKKLQGFVYDYGTNTARSLKREDKGSLKNVRVDDVLNLIGDTPRCYLTGENIDLQDMKSYSFDHKIPISRGGKSNLDNLGLATRVANRSKTDMSHTEFIDFCKKVLIHHGYQISKI